MKWLCLECRQAGRRGVFHVQVPLVPAAGCPECGSRQILDCNVTPIKVPGLADAPWLGASNPDLQTNHGHADH